MNQIQFKGTAGTYKALQSLAVVCRTGTLADIREHTAGLLSDPLFRGVKAQTGLSRFVAWIDRCIAYDYTPFTDVFNASGNSKLPFYAYSTLPGVTCPGAGECLQWCYSVKGWRYFAPFFRQAQNTILERFAPMVLFKAMADIPKGSTVRLYVDGDFQSLSVFRFWMDTIRVNPSLAVYGYSKSLVFFYQLPNVVPANYTLNLSSGGVFDHLKASLRNQPFTRGDFVAVNVGFKVKGKDYGTAKVNKAIRESMPNEKVFPCPGQCGKCTSVGHACGSGMFTGKIIAIAIH